MIKINNTNTSNRIYQKAINIFPDGVTRDVTYLKPFPIYISHGKGSHVWDVDGNEYVDIIMGNGSLMFGHCDNDITIAITEQLTKGIHFGSCSPPEVEWGEIVNDLIPCAEMVRFTTSGSEATHLAIRVARAYTGRDKYICFSSNFHGWHDGVAHGSGFKSKQPDSNGIPKNISDLVKICTPNDKEELLKLIDTDVSCIILEPSGGKIGLIPYDIDFLHFIRKICDKYNIILIFDEVVTGFRWSSGGAQKTLGILPDIATLGKIVGGGLGSGAVVGKADILNIISHDNNIDKRVHHGGTFTGNPIVSIAGAVTLEKLRDGLPQLYANNLTEKLRIKLNKLFDSYSINGKCFGESSVFHISFGDINVNSHSINYNLYEDLQKKLIKNGILMRKFTGILSAVHTEEDVFHICKCFECFFKEMKKNGVL